MKLIYTAVCFFCIGTFSFAQLPTVVSGTVQRIENFQSRYVTPRNIDVWLPAGYNSSVKYSVLYMHDGQMLYDSSITWNRTAWEVDDVVATLLAKGAIENVIVVGIWNGGVTRHKDYFPQKPFESLSMVERDTINRQLQRAGRTAEVFQPVSDNYLKFIVEELKPFVDKNFSTYKDRSHTFIAGSSMGGLISLYAICEYPSVFSGAACLSTHWPGTFTMENNPIPEAFLRYLKSNLPTPKNHKIYFDFGDKTLDAMYPPLQKRVDEVMKSKYRNLRNWLTRFFPGEDHSERAWSKRLEIPLLFLLGKEK